MSHEVTLPVLGESVTSATVSRWLKKVGDAVAHLEPLVEVSTDKVDAEIPSPVSGVLVEIRVHEDETTNVGSVLAVIAERVDQFAPAATVRPWPADGGTRSADRLTPFMASLGVGTGSAPLSSATPAPSVPSDVASGVSDLAPTGLVPPTPTPASLTPATPTPIPTPTEPSSTTPTPFPTPAEPTPAIPTPFPTPAEPIPAIPTPADPPSAIPTPTLSDLTPSSPTPSIWAPPALTDPPTRYSADSALSVSNPTTPTSTPEPTTPLWISAPTNPVLQSPHPSDPNSPTPTPADLNPATLAAPTPATPQLSDPAASAPTPDPAPPTSAPTTPVPSMVTLATSTPTPSATTTADTAAESCPGKETPSDSPVTGQYVTPLVRKLAEELGVDLAQVQGSGVGGRVRKQDVLDASAAPRSEHPRSEHPRSEHPRSDPGSDPSSDNPGSDHRSDPSSDHPRSDHTSSDPSSDHPSSDQADKIEPATSSASPLGPGSDQPEPSRTADPDRLTSMQSELASDLLRPIAYQDPDRPGSPLLGDQPTSQLDPPQPTTTNPSDLGTDSGQAAADRPASRSSQLPSTDQTNKEPAKDSSSYHALPPIELSGQATVGLMPPIAALASTWPITPVKTTTTSATTDPVVGPTTANTGTGADHQPLGKVPTGRDIVPDDPAGLLDEPALGWESGLSDPDEPIPGSGEPTVGDEFQGPDNPADDDEREYDSEVVFNPVMPFDFIPVTPGPSESAPAQLATEDADTSDSRIDQGFSALDVRGSAHPGDNPTSSDVNLTNADFDVNPTNPDSDINPTNPAQPSQDPSGLMTMTSPADPPEGPHTQALNPFADGELPAHHPDEPGETEHQPGELGREPDGTEYVPGETEREPGELAQPQEPRQSDVPSPDQPGETGHQPSELEREPDGTEYVPGETEREPGELAQPQEPRQSDVPSPDQPGETASDPGEHQPGETNTLSPDQPDETGHQPSELEREPDGTEYVPGETEREPRELAQPQEPREPDLSSPDQPGETEREPRETNTPAPGDPDVPTTDDPNATVPTQPDSPGTAAPALAAPTPPVPTADPTALADAWQPIRPRSDLARPIAGSQREMVPLSATVEVDLTVIARLCDRVRAELQARTGASPNHLAFVAKAVCEALKDIPVLNSRFDAAGAIAYADGEHLGIEVDSPQGPLAPVIHGAGELSVTGLAVRIADLASRARADQISADELTGGSFTIANHGTLGALLATPLITQGQVATLDIGAVTRRPVVVDDPRLGEIMTIRDMAYLTLTYDHRLIDRSEATRFLATIKARLEAGDFPTEP